MTEINNKDITATISCSVRSCRVSYIQLKLILDASLPGFSLPSCKQWTEFFTFWSRLSDIWINCNWITDVLNCTSCVLLWNRHSQKQGKIPWHNSVLQECNLLCAIQGAITSGRPGLACARCDHWVSSSVSVHCASPQLFCCEEQQCRFTDGPECELLRKYWHMMALPWWRCVVVWWLRIQLTSVVCGAM